MSSAATQEAKIERLESTFLTGPGGLVYEIPRDVAAKYVVTPQRAKELGHLPIAPYGLQQPASQTPHAHPVGEVPNLAAEGAEHMDVEGRHLAWNPALGWVWHSNPLYGAFVWSDGYVYTGVHYHPYGTELGQGV